MIYAKDRKILEPFQLVKGPTCHACKNGDNCVVVIYKKDSEAKKIIQAELRVCAVAFTC
jgi:hypothetical protein